MSDIRFNQWLHQSGTGGVSQSDGGHVGIGTTNPLIPVGAGNTHILNVGVVTCNNISAGSSITATTFYGSGANLTSLPAQATIANNADNRVITGGSGVNLNGEANLTFDGSVLTNTGSTLIGNDIKSASDDFFVYSYKGGSDGQVRSGIQFDSTNQRMEFYTGTNERFRIASDGVITGRGELRLTEGTSDVSQGDEIGSLMFLNPSNDNRNAKIAALRTTGTSGADLVFYTRTHGDAVNTDGGIERLRIDSSGRVLIGTTTEGAVSANNFTIASSSYCGMTIRSGTSSEGNIFFSDATSGNGESVGMLRYEHANDAMVIKTANAERLRIKSDGNIIIGSGGSWSYPKALNVQGSSGSILSLYNADTTTYAANTSSAIEFKLLTGNTGNQSGSCEIRAFKENGTNGNNARALSFYTGANGGSPTEKLRITSVGEVTKPNNPRFQAYMSGTHFQISGGSSSIAYNTEVYDVGSNYNTSNGRFTAPVAGAYFFQHCLQIRKALSGTGVIESKVWVIPAGGSATERIRDYKEVIATNMASRAFGVLQLNAGDQVYPAYYSGINPSYVQNNGGNTPLTSFFEGYLVG